MRHPLVAGHKLEFIELFNQALVVKQVNEALGFIGFHEAIWNSLDCHQCARCNDCSLYHVFIHACFRDTIRLSASALPLSPGCLVASQEGQPLQIVDVLSAGVDTVAVPGFPMPAAFIFLYERSMFLSLLQHSVAGWNFQVGCSKLNLNVTKLNIQLHSLCVS